MTDTLKIELLNYFRNNRYVFNDNELDSDITEIHNMTFNDYLQTEDDCIVFMQKHNISTKNLLDLCNNGEGIWTKYSLVDLVNTYIYKMSFNYITEFYGPGY